MFGYCLYQIPPILSLPTEIYVADCILVEETTELWPEVVTRSLLEYI